MDGKFEIYFDDLNEDAKKRVLEFLRIEKPEDLNFDVFPLTVISKPRRIDIKIKAIFPNILNS